MGLYEPVVVLAFVIGIYAITRALHWKLRRRLLWWGVAIILAVGALGMAHSLLRHGRLGSPPFSD